MFMGTITELGIILADLVTDQADWSQKTFGTDATRGPTGPLKHLIKEASEAMAEWSRFERNVSSFEAGGAHDGSAKPTPAEFREELADCLLLILDASRRSGCKVMQLLEAAAQKMNKNKSREWPTPSPDMPVEHVRGSEEPGREEDARPPAVPTHAGSYMMFTNSFSPDGKSQFVTIANHSSDGKRIDLNSRWYVGYGDTAAESQRACFEDTDTARRRGWHWRIVHKPDGIDVKGRPSPHYLAFGTREKPDGGEEIVFCCGDTQGEALEGVRREARKVDSTDPTPRIPSFPPETEIRDAGGKLMGYLGEASGTVKTEAADERNGEYTFTLNEVTGPGVFRPYWIATASQMMANRCVYIAATVAGLSSEDCMFALAKQLQQK